MLWMSLSGSDEEKEEFRKFYEHECDALEKVAETFNCDIDDLPSGLNELVHAPLQVPLQDSEDMQELASLTDRAMTGELNRLAEQEWSRRGMTSDQIEALRTFKKHQWRTKKAYLMLTASELARREVSPHTKSCEVQLHKANVESHLEEVFADESIWLKNGMGGQISKCELTAARFDDDEIRDITRRKIIAAVGDELSTIPRRISTAGGESKAINEQISPEAMSKEIATRIQQLKDNGVTTKSWRELDEIAYRLVTTGSTQVPTIRKALVSESTKAFDEAIKITDQVISGFYLTRKGNKQQIRPIGYEQIIKLGDELKAKAKLVSEGEGKGVDEALKTRETIEKHYQELMRAISWVGFDGTDFGRNECDEAFDRVCRLMKPVIDIPDGRKASTHNVGKLKWEPDAEFKGKGLEESFLARYSFSEAVKERLKQDEKKFGSKVKVNVNAVYRLIWKERKSSKSTRLPEYGAVRVPLSETTTVKASAIPNAQRLDLAVREAENALKRQQRSDEAMKLCQKAPDTDTQLYENCMDEVLQQLLGWYAEYSAEVKKKSLREQERIHQQSQLMQVPMVQAY